MRGLAPLRAAALLLALAACGFQPALVPGGGPGPVRLAEPDTRLGFVYRAAIQDRLGPAGPGAPLLSWSLDVEEDTIAVTAAEEIRRVQIAGAADWTLTDGAGAALAGGREEGFTSWSATGTTVSIRAAERDAQDRLMRILADRTVARLILLGTPP